MFSTKASFERASAARYCSPPCSSTLMNRLSTSTSSDMRFVITSPECYMNDAVVSTKSDRRASGEYG